MSWPPQPGRTISSTKPDDDHSALASTPEHELRRERSVETVRGKGQSSVSSSHGQPDFPLEAVWRAVNVDISIYGTRIAEK